MVNNEKEEGVPVLPISSKDWQRMIRAGYGLLRMQSGVVAVFRPVEPVYFDRGADDAEIVEAWEKKHG